MNTHNPQPIRWHATTLVMSLCVSLFVPGCEHEITAEATVVPELLAVSKTQVSIGAPLELYGKGFLLNVRGYTTLRFEGTFDSVSGAKTDVEYTVRPHRIGNGVLRWSNIGPFTNPFVCPEANKYNPDAWECNDIAGDDLLGTFDGTVTATNFFNEGGRVEGEAIPLTLEFGPSLVIRKLRPLGSECPQPVKRIIGGFPYEIEVEAIGFEAKNFTLLTDNEPGMDSRARVQRAIPVNGVATLGRSIRDAIYFMPLTEDNDSVFYAADFRIIAQGMKNEKVTASYAFGVHRPLEYIDLGTPQVAEIEAPQPVSGCLSGGLNMLSVSYDETKTITRNRGFSFSYTKNWTEERSTNFSQSHEKRHGTNSQFTEGKDENWNYNWNEEKRGGWDAGGSVTVGVAPFGVGGQVSGTASVNRGWSNQNGGSEGGSKNESLTVGSDYSESDSESWAFTESTNLGETVGNTASGEVSSSESITSRYSLEILPGLQGVWYQQPMRLIRPGRLIEYNLCGEYAVVADVQHSDYKWNFALAQGETCTPLPEPLMPKAQCIIGCKD